MRNLIDFFLNVITWLQAGFQKLWDWLHSTFSGLMVFATTGISIIMMPLLVGMALINDWFASCNSAFNSGGMTADLPTDVFFVSWCSRFNYIFPLSETATVFVYCVALYAIVVCLRFVARNIEMLVGR